MAIGDVYEVDTGDCDDLYYVDAGIYGVPEYGAVYVLDAERPAIVDTGIGTGYEDVLDAIEAAGISLDDLEVIAPTHVHLDHAGGAGYIAEACPNAEVVCHERGARHLVDPSRLWEGTRRAVGDRIEHYAEPEPVPGDRVREVSGGDVVDLGDHALEVHDAPGHAPHQAVFFDPANDALFTADAAGIYVPALDRVDVTTPPPNFDFEQCVADVRTCQEVDPSVLCYAHYGPAPRDDRLEAYADVLTGWVEAIEAERDELEDDEAVVDHFVERQELGDVWGEETARSVTEADVRGVLHYLDEREE